MRVTRAVTSPECLCGEVKVSCIGDVRSDARASAIATTTGAARHESQGTAEPPLVCARAAGAVLNDLRLHMWHVTGEFSIPRTPGLSTNSGSGSTGPCCRTAACRCGAVSRVPVPVARLASTGDAGVRP